MSHSYIGTTKTLESKQLKDIWKLVFESLLMRGKCPADLYFQSHTNIKAGQIVLICRSGIGVFTAKMPFTLDSISEWPNIRIWHSMGNKPSNYNARGLNKDYAILDTDYYHDILKLWRKLGKETTGISWFESEDHSMIDFHLESN